MRRMLTLFLVLCINYTMYAQETFPIHGVKDSRDGHYAFTNATIYKSATEKIDNATLVIKKGKIISVSSGERVPTGAVEIDAKGKTIYPSFIELYSNYGMPEVKKSEGGGWNKPIQMLSKKNGAYSWNQALKTEFRAHEHFSAKDKSAAEWRKLGFGAVLSHRMDGISRGTSTLVTLAKDRDHKVILKDKVAHHFAFKKGTSTQNYPGSLMGGIALIKQTYLDGMWYENHGYKEEKNLSLEAWNEVQDLPQIFETGDKQEILRAALIAKEFGKKYIIRGNGDEYQRLEAIKATGSPIILPVDYPIAYDVEDPYDAMKIELSDLKHWELAPTNAGHLAAEGIEFAFTTDKLKKKSDFLGNIRKAIKNGLSEEDALKALTSTPAKLIGASDIIGSLSRGKIANFIITSGNIFDKKTKIYHNWVSGKPYVFSNLDAVDLNGMYDLKVGEQNYSLKVTDSDSKAKMQIIVNDTTNINVKHTYQNGLISLSFTPDGEKKIVRLSGVVDDNVWSGSGQLGSGVWADWQATPSGVVEAEEDKKKKDKKDKEKVAAKLGEISYPFMAYGWTEKPKVESWLFKNATVWTNESDGILEEADVLIQDGKIKSVGKGLEAGGANVIDATGKHITCGIIDEHSHIAISRGVNECTQANTAEVSIADVVNADDINIYRQLAGGVTTSQLLHGSCNPIGGQSALIKLRWGYAPEDMKIKNAPGFIKFALGENVKRSRSSSNNRFPDSRMGVEQVYVDNFTRAKEYETRKKAGDNTLRKDLEMETLVEILNNKRFITCHSYVQSEINMLMKVGEQMGFKVNTFTHILEGYKVADKMKSHGVGGSTFSDWWAYKYEVIDAIPQNSTIMHNQGVTVAINSDDAEMARRLNQEAAKSVMYTDISEEEAWKFVTLNPAKLLRLDDRMGSLKAGKDADVVLWSDNPLSVYAKAEMTFVDGIKFFDRTLDEELQEQIRTERARLIQKMLAVKKDGKPTQGPKGRNPHHYHCDDDHDEMAEH